MDTELKVGTEIGDRTVSDICCQVVLGLTVVTAVRFWDGSFGILTSGDREPDLWPVSPAAASFIGAASLIDTLHLAPESGDLPQHVYVTGMRDGRRFAARLFFGMWPKAQREDTIIQY